MKKFLLLVCILISLAGCGGGGNEAGDDSVVIGPADTFWALDLRTSPNEPYKLKANKVITGTYCDVYLESEYLDKGNPVSIADLRNIANTFDTKIYPKLRAAFGHEWTSVSGESKVYILLLDIKDNFDTQSEYVGGYFISDDLYKSNGKKILYMDIYPGLYYPGFYRPGNPDPGFLRTLAHEFQHMIHYCVKNGDDETWLDEAMSEIAPFYVFDTPSWDRVWHFEKDSNHSDSLTDWNSTLEDYAVVYMWAQYMADRFPGDVFKSILAKSGTGESSVNAYLAGLGTSFATVFQDWSIAIFFGNNTNTAVAGNNPDPNRWSYKKIDTWRSTRFHDGSLLNFPGLFTAGNLNRPAQTPGPWSLRYYWYNTPATPLQWNNDGSSTLHASLYRPGANPLFTFNLSHGTLYPYNNTAYLILQNTGSSSASPISPAVDQIFSADQADSSDQAFSAGQPSSAQPKAPLTPTEKLTAFSRNKSIEATAGKPIPVCIRDILSHHDGEILRSTQKNQDAR